MIFFETKYFQRITVVQRERRGLRIPNRITVERKQEEENRVLGSMGGVIGM